MLSWKKGSVPFAAKLFAHLGRAAILPDDRAREGLRRLAIPEAKRLALVGDSDGDDFSRVDMLGHLTHRLDHRRPDVVQVVLHPTRLREMLLKIHIRLGDAIEVRVHQQAPSFRSFPDRSRECSPCELVTPFYQGLAMRNTGQWPGCGVKMLPQGEKVSGYF